MDNQIQLTKEQTCILFRDKTEIWIDKENEPKVSALIAESSGLVKINGKLRNKHEIKGIYSAKEMEDIYKTGKGLIKCTKCGTWNNRFDKCPCEVPEEADRPNDYYDFPPLTKVIVENKSGLGGLAKRYTMHTIKGYKPYTEYEIGEEELKAIREHNRMMSRIKLGKNSYPFISLDLSSIRVKGKKERLGIK